MAKPFEWSIDEQGFFDYRRNAGTIPAEAAFDGLYVIRISLADSELDAQATVRAYKQTPQRTTPTRQHHSQALS